MSLYRDAAKNRERLGFAMDIYLRVAISEKNECHDALLVFDDAPV